MDSQAFKQTMSQFASGVTVVTTTLDGRHYGLTVSAFTSVSLNPPLVLACIDKRLEAHGVIERGGIFAVNILCEEQLEIGRRFAGMIPEIIDRFDGIAYSTATTGSPILPDSLGWVDCSVWKVYDGGDHSIFVGEVLASSAAVEVLPLVYHNREWRRTGALGFE
ncbi:MAG: flavin reductase family protein [Acidobacteriota bacterium]